GKFIYSKNPKISLLKITPIMFGNDFEGELKVYTSFPKFIDCNYFLISPSGNQIFSLGSGGCNSDGKMSFGVSIQNYLIPQIIKKEFGTWKVVVQGENSDMGYFSEGKFIYFSPTTQKSSCNSNGICTLYEKEFHEGISVESISKEGVKLRMGGDNKSEGEVTPLLNKGGEYIFHQPIGSENKGDLLVEILSINPPTKNIDRWSVDFRITNLMSQINSTKEDNSLKSDATSEFNTPQVVSSEADCTSGCYSDGACYPFGYRVNGMYCSSDKTFVTQLGSNLACENSFECGSNLCVNNQCVDQGLFQKILNWFSKLFGGSSA
ncbi:hypothetical protein CO037_00150, partial [Candidatus Pacearchaeota archaeon CG_4_9_14_0_2_um_filter_30_8]